VWKFEDVRWNSELNSVECIFRLGRESYRCRVTLAALQLLQPELLDVDKRGLAVVAFWDREEELARAVRRHISTEEEIVTIDAADLQTN
jgi:hypothetical protein